MRLFLFVLLAWQAVCQPVPDEMLQRAVALAASGRMDEAEAILRKGRSEFPRDGRFAVELAGVAWRKTQPGRAKRYLRQALRLDPGNAYANEFLGSLYLLDGNVYAGLKYLNRVRRPVLGEIVFDPRPPLRADWSERLAAVSEGQLLTPERLAQTERNLDRLRVFQADPRVELAPAQGEEYRLTIRAQPLADGIGRLLPLLRGLPYQQVNLDWLNIGGRAINLTSLWRWDADKRRIAVRYRVPVRSGAYSVWTDLRDEDWELNRGDAFGVRSGEVGGALEFELDAGRWTPSAHLSRHTFRNAGADALFANSTTWELRNRFDFRRLRIPERRLQVDSAVTLRTGRVFSRDSSRLAGAELAVASLWLPQQKDDLYSVRVQLRAGALSGNVPIDQLYIAAMERDNDLWVRGHAGTREGRKGNAAMGTRYAVMQTEVMRRMLRLPMLRVDAGPFFDVANTGGRRVVGSHGWLYDSGAQAVVTTFGGVRFSFIYGRDLRNGSNVVYTMVSR